MVARKLTITVPFEADGLEVTVSAMLDAAAEGGEFRLELARLNRLHAFVLKLRELANADPKPAEIDPPAGPMPPAEAAPWSIKVERAAAEILHRLNSRSPCRTPSLRGHVLALLESATAPDERVRIFEEALERLCKAGRIETSGRGWWALA